MEQPIKQQLRENLRPAGLAESSRVFYLEVETVELFFKRTWLAPESNLSTLVILNTIAEHERVKSISATNGPKMCPKESQLICFVGILFFF